MIVDDSYHGRRGARSGRGDEGDDEAKLPLIVLPRTGAHMAEHVLSMRICVARCLSRMGIILFRGFPVQHPGEFTAIVAALRDEACATGIAEPARMALSPHPRTTSARETHHDRAWRLASNVGREVVQPERWYCQRLPQRIWIYCAGGRAHLAVADAREVHVRLPQGLCERWTTSGLRVTRSYSASGASSWQRAFASSDRRRVEAWCDAEGFCCEWQPLGGLTIHKMCRPAARHSGTGDLAWFNAAQAYQPPNPRSSGVFTKMAVLRGDGRLLLARDLRAIRTELDAVTLRVSCEPGDIFVLDNLLMGHAIQSSPASDAGLYVLHEYANGLEIPARDPVAGR